jgi:hypothetical protein
MELITDMRGERIDLGDLIAYPGRQSSSLWLTIARVVGIADGKKQLKVLPIQTTRYSMPTKPVVLINLQNVLRIEDTNRPLSPEENARVREVLNGQGKIQAIKFIRQDLRTSWGLKEAYDVVQALS